jgi:FkbM family methyltransferase
LYFYPHEWIAKIASSFQALYRKGMVGVDYQDVYFLNRIIDEGFYCIDIGAHLGYYTMELSRLVKNSGRVYAVEPISKFHNALNHLLQKKKIQNVTLYQRAMGGGSDFVEMGIPKINKMKKFAYARIMNPEDQLEYSESESIRNESGDSLFHSIPRLDFIKCDVEGREIPVFVSMILTISQFKPIILCELADKGERIKLYQLLLPLGYNVFYLENMKLWKMDPQSDKRPISHNHYFIPANHEHRLAAFIEFNSSSAG